MANQNQNKTEVDTRDAQIETLKASLTEALDALADANEFILDIEKKLDTANTILASHKARLGL